jgi:hypothetical protein
MKNKKSCSHKYGFKTFIWVTPLDKKIEYKTCKKCKKKFRVGVVGNV